MENKSPSYTRLSCRNVKYESGIGDSIFNKVSRRFEQIEKSYQTSGWKKKHKQILNVLVDTVVGEKEELKLQ